MKKMIFVSLLALASSSVFAADACTGASPPVGTAIPGSATNFVRVGFTPQCSANTYVKYTDDAATQKLYGGAASGKGKSIYSASTAGGAVQKSGDCPNGSCGGAAAATRANEGMTTAATYGSS